MARLFDDASTEYLKIDSTVVSAVPFAVSIWFRRDADVESIPFCLVDKDSNVHGFVIQCLASGESNFVRAFSRDAGGYGIATTSTGITDNVWQHVVALFVSDTDRRVLLNNAGKGTNATDITPANIDRMAVGYWGISSPSNYFSGDIAETAIWDLSNWPGATAGDKADNFEKIIDSLAKGYSPEHYLLGLVSHWNLIRGLNDKVGGYNLTANGTFVSEHPRIILPSRFLAIPFLSAQVHSLAGSISAVSTVVGNLPVSTSLIGTITASSGATGSLSVGTSEVSVVTATSSVSGSLSVLTPLAGSATATSSASGALYIPADFIGSVTAASNVTGDMLVRWNLYGSTGSTSTASANLNAEISLFGYISTVSTAAGILGFTELRMQGAVNSVSGAAGSLSILTPLAGTVSESSNVTGVIYDVRTITLVGSATGNSSANANLDILTQLAGSITSVSGTADFLILNAVKFSGVVSGESSLTGYATCLWRLFGTVAAASSTLGTYTIDLYPDFGATTLFYRPQANIIETLEWMTSILKSQDGTEQRIKVRQSPRQYFRYQILLETDKLNNWIDSQVHGWLKLKWLVPVWTEAVKHTADISHHDATIAVDTTETDFRAAGLAMVWKSPTEYEVVKISTLQDNQITLNTNYGILGTFTGTKYIMPVREAYITGNVNKARHNSPVGIATIVFKIYDNTNLTGWEPTQNYDGMPVLNSPAFMERTHNEGSNPNNIVLDYKTGIFEIINHTDFNYTTQDHIFYNDTKTTCWNFRKFLCSLNGKQKSILIPTFRSDFTQYGTIVSGQTYVDIEYMGLAENVGVNKMRKYIGFYFPSTGQIIVRTITNIASTAHSFLHATTERITFNTDLGYANILSPGDCQIGWVDKCRLSSDTVELNWERINKNVCDTKFARII